MICDFCSAPEPEWVCPCATYAVPDLPGVVSESHWAACAACAELVCRRDWAALSRRGLATQAGKMLREIVGEEAARAEILRLHEGYRQHAAGEPRKADAP